MSKTQKIIALCGIGLIVILMVIVFVSNSQNNIVLEEQALEQNMSGKQNSFVAGIDMGDSMMYRNDLIPFSLQYPYDYQVIISPSESYIASRLKSGDFQFSLHSSDDSAGIISFRFLREGVVLGGGLYTPRIFGYRVTALGQYEVLLVGKWNSEEPRWIEVEPIDMLSTELGDVLLVPGDFASISSSVIAIGNLPGHDYVDAFFVILSEENYQYMDLEMFKTILNTIAD